MAALGEVLRRSELYVALAEPASLGPEKQTLSAGTTFVLHDLKAADGKSWAALFTSVDALRRAGERQNWTTDGGRLQIFEINGSEALHSLFVEPLAAGAKAGIVFDIGETSELDMTAVEVLSMLKGEAIPLVAYASRGPTRENEQVFIGEPAIPPSTVVVEAIRAALVGEPSVISHRVLQVYMPERDLASHLLLDIRTMAPEPERRRISQRVDAAIAGLELPAPGYMDVAFNFKDE